MYDKAIQTEEESGFLSPKINLSEFALDFSTNTTLHGYRYLFSERGYRRLIWFTVMLIAFCFSVYSVRDQFYNFGNKTKTTFEIEDTEYFDFPTVSICLSQPAYYKRDITSKLNITKKDFARLYQKMERLMTHKIQFNESVLIDKLAAANITSYRSFLRIFSMTLEDMMKDYVVKCKFEGRPCQVEDFKATLSPQGHLCGTFNYYKKDNESMKTSSTDSTSGLNMIINLNNKRRLLDDVINDQMLFFAAHPYGNFIDMSMITEFEVLRAGTANIIHLDEILVKLLPKPYESGCGERELQFATEYTYSKSMCHIDRELHNFMTVCGCVPPTHEEITGKHFPLCKLKQLQCLATVNPTKLNTSWQESPCPYECNRRRYKKGILTYELNYKAHEQYKRKNFILLKLKFRDSLIRIERQEPAVTLGGLLGGVGGSFGLFLGFSFLTFVEFLYFAWDAFFIWLKKSKSADKRGKNDGPVYF